MTIEITGHNFIAGQAVAGSSTTFQAVNPATSEATPHTFYEATLESIDAAADAAADAFKFMRNTSTEQRAALLEAIADEIEALGEVLLETGNEEDSTRLATHDRRSADGQQGNYALLPRFCVKAHMLMQLLTPRCLTVNHHAQTFGGCLFRLGLLLFSPRIIFHSHLGLWVAIQLQHSQQVVP